MYTRTRVEYASIYVCAYYVYINCTERKNYVFKRDKIYYL